MASASPAAAFLAFCIIGASAQTPPQEVSIRTHAYVPPSTILHAESNLVETGLTVRDRDGHTVAGLQASDFELLDNGAPQQVSSFTVLSSDRRSTVATARPEAQTADTAVNGAVGAAEPRYITFFFDDIHTFELDGPVTKNTAGVAFLKQAAHAFIDQGVKPTDWLSIVTASGQGDLDFTQDAQLFARKFDGLRSRAYAMSRAAYQVQTLNMIAAMSYAAKRLSEEHGTRVLLVISHGFPNTIGRPEVENFLEAVARWNITIHAIYAKGLDITPPELSPGEIIAWENARWFNSLPLQEMAERTGGHLFKDTNGFGDAMEEAVYPEVTYLVAFRPGNPDGKFHTLKIRFTSKRDDSLEYRQSYFSPKDDQAEKQLEARARVDSAVFSKDILHDVPAVVSLAGGPPKDGIVPVVISIRVDVARLPFASSGGRHMQQMVF